MTVDTKTLAIIAKDSPDLLKARSIRLEVGTWYCGSGISTPEAVIDLLCWAMVKDLWEKYSPELNHHERTGYFTSIVRSDGSPHCYEADTMLAVLYAAWLARGKS